VRGVEPNDGVDVVGRHALLLFCPPLLRKIPGLLHSPHQNGGESEPVARVVCRVVSCDVVWCRVVSCGVVWCRVVSCGVVWCRVVSCGVVCRVSCVVCDEPRRIGSVCGRENLICRHSRRSRCSTPAGFRTVTAGLAAALASSYAVNQRRTNTHARTQAGERATTMWRAGDAAALCE
jgi:hypothetical protein